MNKGAAAVPMSRSRGAVLLSTARLVSMLTQIVAIPILIRILGEEQFGLCLWIVALTAFAVLADPGLIEGGIVYLMRAQAKESNLKPEDVWKTHKLYSLMHAGVAAILFLLVGLFVPMESRSFAERMLLFGLGAVYYGGQAVQSANMHYLTATRLYDRLALVNAFGNTLGVIAALALTHFFRTPAAYILGLLCGTLITTNAGALMIRRHRASIQQPPGKFDSALARSFLVAGWKSYPNRLLSLMAGIGDRLVLGGVSKQSLTNYETSTRIPGGLNELTSVLRSTIQADIAQSYVRGPEEFARTLDRYSRMSLALGICMVMVPSAFGAAILRAWLGDGMYAGGATVMIGIATYRTFELYYGCHGLAMMAALKPQLMFPAVLWNALATIICTLPMFRMFGVEGLAYMNVGINVVQLIPLVFLSSKMVAPGLKLRPHLLAVTKLFLIGTGVSSLAYASMHLPFFESYPWVGICLIPLGPILAFALIFGLRLVPTPDPVAKIVDRVIPGARNWLAH